MHDELSLPVAFDTDVNGAALAENRWGAARGLNDFVYLTIGTGIDGGGMANGEFMHGSVHPEMGHILIPHDRRDDPFTGACTFHGDCFEGLASGPAIDKRWGTRGEELSPDHAAWKLEARYIALALVNLICALSPQKMILGGVVMQRAELFAMVLQCVRELLNGYLHAEEIIARIEDYILPPALGKRAGVLGAIALAKKISRV